MYIYTHNHTHKAYMWRLPYLTCVPPYYFPIGPRRVSQARGAAADVHITHTHTHTQTLLDSWRRRLSCTLRQRATYFTTSPLTLRQHHFLYDSATYFTLLRKELLDVRQEAAGYAGREAAGYAGNEGTEPPVRALSPTTLTQRGYPLVPFLFFFSWWVCHAGMHP